MQDGIVKGYLFQSTPPCRRRLRQLELRSRFIHFNPRLRVGGDKSFKQSAQDAIKFQSTPPCRRRRMPIPSWPVMLNFNPRLRVGGDAIPGTSTRQATYFNPRLRVGGDEPTGYQEHPWNISIHASV